MCNFIPFVQMLRLGCKLICLCKKLHVLNIFCCSNINCNHNVHFNFSDSVFFEEKKAVPPWPGPHEIQKSGWPPRIIHGLRDKQRFFMEKHVVQCFCPIHLTLSITAPQLCQMSVICVLAGMIPYAGSAGWRLPFFLLSVSSCLKVGQLGPSSVICRH